MDETVTTPYTIAEVYPPGFITGIRGLVCRLETYLAEGN